MRWSECSRLEKGLLGSSRMVSTVDEGMFYGRAEARKGRVW